MSGDLSRFVAAMKWAADSDRVGYSQSDRTSVWGHFHGTGKYNADCSSLAIGALKHAGFDTGDAGWSGNMREELCARGWRAVKPNGRPQVGDILLNEVNHVAVCTSAGMVTEASRDERGKYAGGKRGDQDGDEVRTRAYYDFPWDCYLRWGGAKAAKSGAKSAKPPAQPTYRVYSRGKWGAWKSGGATAGYYGESAYDFEARGLGPKGWYRLTLEGGKVLGRNKGNASRSRRVIGVEVYYDTPSPESTGYYEALYRVRTAGGWLKWEHDVDDGGAGDDRSPVCQVQLKIAKC